MDNSNIKLYAGTVLSLHKDGGFGYIRPDWSDGNFDENLFFHFKRTVPKKCFATEGLRVAFTLEKDIKGRYMATNVMDCKYLTDQEIDNLIKERPCELPNVETMKKLRKEIKTQDLRNSLRTVEEIEQEEEKKRIENIHAVEQYCEEQEDAIDFLLHDDLSFNKTHSYFDEEKERK